MFQIKDVQDFYTVGYQL